MKGVGWDYKEIQRDWVISPKCRKNLTRCHWIRTEKPRTEWQREFQYKREKGKVWVTSPGITG